MARDMEDLSPDRRRQSFMVPRSEQHTEIGSMFSRRFRSPGDASVHPALIMRVYGAIAELGGLVR